MKNRKERLIDFLKSMGIGTETDEMAGKWTTVWASAHRELSFDRCAIQVAAPSGLKYHIFEIP